MPEESHGRRSLVGCSPWGHEESDTTERLHFHFSLSCIGEGSGNPLQCSCLENPRDGGAWWAAIYGVTQSRTRLKQLSSSSSSSSRKVPKGREKQRQSWAMDRNSRDGGVWWAAIYGVAQSRTQLKRLSSSSSSSPVLKADLTLVEC